MTDALNPALILILGAALVPAVRGPWRGPYLVALPVAAIVQLCALYLDPAGDGVYGRLAVFGLDLVTLRLDALSFLFALIFLVAGVIAAVYALHLKDTLQHCAALVYAGAGVGAVLAGDLITLFVFWELTAIASVFLIWARRTEKALRVGIRYLVIQILSGVALLAGIALHVQATGSVAFDHIGLDGPGGGFILLAFGIKCAFPLLHNWLQDAYPEATVTGTVVLSVYTTKLAVYALARGYAGTDMLIWVGAAMTAFPIFFAVIENDMRRVLSYSLNNQLGFMVTGVGIGTELALNGTAAHAFCHILYKALLFMSMGAVLHRTGTIRASELGGLYKSMPLTAAFCIVGSMSISAFPLFSGFISKSMILAAAAAEHHWLVWLVLLFASAGVLDHSGIKIPFFTFFFHDSGIRCREAPRNMLVAMGATAFLCIALGVYPQPLYALLPHAVDFDPYTTTHVITQLQLLMFSALAFTVLLRRGIYPAEIPAHNLDTDWVYRRFLPAVLARLGRAVGLLRRWAADAAVGRFSALVDYTERHYGLQGGMSRTWPARHMVLWVAVMLGALLILYLG